MTRKKKIDRSLAKSPSAAYTSALADGNLTTLDPIVGASLGEQELVRQQLLAAIQLRGVLIENQVGVDRSGNPITKTEANPALGHLSKFSEQLGHTAKDTLLSRQARGQTARDLADAAAEMSRQQRLTAWCKDPANAAKIASLTPPRGRQKAIDITVVPNVKALS